MGEEEKTSFGYYDNQPLGGGDYSDESQQPEEAGVLIEWQASEYIHHNKTNLWFVGLGVAVIGAIALLFVFIENWGLDDWLLVLLIISMTAAVAVYANRTPETLKYSLDDEGLDVGERFYAMEEFRSFSLLQESGLFGVELMPLQRFRPPLSVYFAREDSESIVNLLSGFLPLEEKSLDVVDRIVKKIRF